MASTKARDPREGDSAVGSQRGRVGEEGTNGSYHPVVRRTSTSRRFHRERHASQRAAWLRAGVLGANDGLLSTAAILIGVVAADQERSVLVITGLAALLAGA